MTDPVNDTTALVKALRHCKHVYGTFEIIELAQQAANEIERLQALAVRALTPPFPDHLRIDLFHFINGLPLTGDVHASRIDLIRRMERFVTERYSSSQDSDGPSEVERLRAALSKIAFITGGLDTPATSNAAHYEAVNALSPKGSSEPGAAASTPALLADMLAAFREISKQYENQNLNHVDFRVAAKRTADAMIERAKGSSEPGAAECERLSALWIAETRENERLLIALQRYGLHTWDCDFNDSRGARPCDCGWTGIESEIEAAATALPQSGVPTLTCPEGE